MIAAVGLLLLANVIAVVTEILGSHTPRVVRIDPIAVYDGGKYADAVSDFTSPRRRMSPLNWTHRFVLVSRGVKVATADVFYTLLPPRATGSPCSRTVEGYARISDPKSFDHGIAAIPGLAVSGYTQARGLSSSTLDPIDPRYSKDVLAAALSVLRRAGKSSDGLHLQSIDVMDVYHDGQPEVFARLLNRDFMFIWLAYKGGKPELLRADTQVAAGGPGGGPHFIDTVDVDGDGVDEVVIQQELGSASQYEIYRVTHDSVTRVFQGGVYGC